MLLPQNYWLVFCFLHYIVFKVLLPDFPVFMLFFGALLFAIVSRDSLFSIAIGVRFVNHFFDLFFKVLTLLDLVLPALLWCSIILLLSISKCKCFLHKTVTNISGLYLPLFQATTGCFATAIAFYIKCFAQCRVDKRSFFAVFYIGNLNR